MTTAIGSATGVEATNSTKVVEPTKTYLTATREKLTTCYEATASKMSTLKGKTVEHYNTAAGKVKTLMQRITDFVSKFFAPVTSRVSAGLDKLSALCGSRYYKPQIEELNEKIRKLSPGTPKADEAVPAPVSNCTIM